MEASPATPVEEAPAAPSALSKFKDFLRMLWKHPQEQFLVRIFLFTGLGSILILVCATMLFLRQIHPPAAHEEEIAEHEEVEESGHEEVAEGHGGEKSEHGEPEKAVLGGSPFPREIVKAQDGVMEEGHDIIEPEIESTRDIASLMKSDLKVSLGTRYVEITQIQVSPRYGGRSDGSLSIDVALEVGSLESKDEVEKRQTEIKALVTALGSSKQRSELKTTEGILQLKLDIQHELNLVLAKGKITDVLFMNYNLK